ncbi:hypothetical protein LXL04_023577 [Taraxacum kok-saghyz]
MLLWTITLCVKTLLMALSKFNTDQLADILTKPLGRGPVLLLRSKIGVSDGSSILRGRIADHFISQAKGKQMISNPSCSDASGFPLVEVSGSRLPKEHMLLIVSHEPAEVKKEAADL